MKFLNISDIHRRDSRPANRVDDYAEAQDSALEQVVQIAIDRGVDAIALGGDTFDSVNVSFGLAYRTVEIFAKAVAAGIKIVACLGQHEIHNHRTALYGKSPVKMLEYALGEGFVTLINENSVVQLGDVKFYGANWNEAPAEISGEGKHIFLGHKSVFDSVPGYWKGEAFTPDSLQAAYPGFDYYFCGDIHSTLIEGPVIVSGSLMRQNIDQVKHKPCVVIVDTDTGAIETEYLVVAPVEDCFVAFDKALAESETSTEEIEQLVDALKSSAGIKNSFEHDSVSIAEATKNPKVTIFVKEIINELK